MCTGTVKEGMLSWLVVVGSDLVCRGREKERNRKRGKEGDAEIIEDQKVRKLWRKRLYRVVQENETGMK